MLRHRERAEVEEDIARNFADDVVIWSSFGLFRGHEGVRRSAHALHEQLRCAHYQFPTKLVSQLAGAQGELAGLTVTRPSLEDVYLDLIGEKP